MTVISNDIGRRIKEIREKRGITQEELGRTLGGIGKAAVQKIESGKTSLGVDKLMLICENFRVHPTNLLYGSFPKHWEKLYGVKNIGDSPPQEALDLLARLESLAEDRFGPKGIILLRDIDSLNEIGIDRALAYVSDLVRIDAYTKEQNPN